MKITYEEMLSRDGYYWAKHEDTDGSSEDDWVILWVCGGTAHMDDVLADHEDFDEYQTVNKPWEANLDGDLESRYRKSIEILEGL